MAWPGSQIGWFTEGLLGGRLAQRQAALREVMAVCHGQLRSVLAVQIESTPRATAFPRSAEIISGGMPALAISIFYNKDESG
jgi:hypothetical protein